MPMYGYGMFGYSPFGGILQVFLMILLIAIIVRILRPSSHWSRRSFHHWGNDSKDAVDILKERYAKGEINTEEFEKKKADLMK